MSDTEPEVQPITCAYCERKSDPEVAYYGANGFVLCDDCAREVEEEFADDTRDAVWIITDLGSEDPDAIPAEVLHAR